MTISYYIYHMIAMSVNGFIGLCMVAYSIEAILRRESLVDLGGIEPPTFRM